MEHVMRPTWLVAKYMDDLRRREPRNVGVLLFTDETVLDRFLGARDDGTIDGRRTSLTGAPLENYKAWVAYWRHAAKAAPANPQALLELARGDANYFLEEGGEQLVGVDSPADLLAELYDMLVGDGDTEKPQTVHAAAERLIYHLNLTDRVQRGVTVQRRVPGALDVLHFDYRYDNGRPHFMEAVSMGRGDRAWNVVHQTIYQFEKLREADNLTNPHGIALVAGDAPQAPLDVLRGIVPVIDLDDETADDKLAAQLHL